MNVLVLGGGGREHAICFKIRESKKLTNLYCIPGNTGIQKIAECIDGDLMDFEKINDVVKAKNIELIVVGPEAPLVAGIVDYFQDKGIMIFGPDKKGAQLEGSKCFSKEILQKYNIPTANFKNFNDKQEALKFVNEFPIVIKADGLAGGKGAVIVENKQDAEKILDEVMTKKIFGSAGNKVVIEEFLRGFEVSLHIVVSGKNYKLLPFSQDHKQIFDGDKGPNTGGMGAYSPTPLVNDKLLQKIESEIIKPLLDGFLNEGINYKGILYVGLMVDNDNPKVLEFNVRFGDPETQVLLPILETDFLELALAVCNGDLTNLNFKIKNKFALAITLASKGYPETAEKGIEIFGLDEFKNNENDDILVFHAGTIEKNGKILTNGGRVLTFVAFADTLKLATEKAYSNIGKIKFQGMQFRRDIAQRECLKRFI